MTGIVRESLAAVLSAPRTIEVRPVPAGPLPAAGAWLEIEACGVCGSDWSWYAERDIPAPFVPGHEMVGRVKRAWADLLVDTTPGATDILASAARCVAIGGRVIVAGLKHGASSLVPTDVLVRREIEIRGVAARESWAIDAALTWMAQDPALFGAFSSVTVGLAEVERVLLTLGGEAGDMRPVHAVVQPDTG